MGGGVERRCFMRDRRTGSLVLGGAVNHRKTINK